MARQILSQATLYHLLAVIGTPRNQSLSEMQIELIRENILYVKAKVPDWFEA
jgi:hypothetical protein